MDGDKLVGRPFGRIDPRRLVTCRRSEPETFRAFVAF